MDNRIKETAELLRPIITSIAKTFTASSVVDNTDGTYTLATEDTLWLSLGFIFSISSVQYKVTAITVDESVTLSGASIPAASFDIYAPYFRHGTTLSTVNELKLKTLDREKFPLIYLHAVTSENIKNTPTSSIERESKCEIYFLAPANFNDWTNAQHWNYCIRPMRKLLFAFIDTLNESGLIARDSMEDFDVTDQPRFGVYLDNRGMEKKIIDDHLSGTGLFITIPFQKICC